MTKRTDTTISVPVDTLAALNAVRDRLAARLGFRPTIAQAIQWLIANASQ
jgi:hypothetical protein